VQGYKTFEFSPPADPSTRCRIRQRYFEGFGGGTRVVVPILEKPSATLFLDSASPRTPVGLELTSIRKRRDSSHRNSLISCWIRSNRRSTARNLRKARIATIKNVKIKQNTKYSGFITRHPVTCKRAGRPEDMCRDPIALNLCCRSLRRIADPTILLIQWSGSLVHAATLIADFD
jgi:ribosomal protein S14